MPLGQKSQETASVGVGSEGGTAELGEGERKLPIYHAHVTGQGRSSALDRGKVCLNNTIDS